MTSIKRLFISLILVMTVITSFAIPAKPGQWSNITLADGTTIRVQVVGDEHGHYLMAEDGTTYQMIDSNYVRTDVTQLIKKARTRRAQANARCATNMQKQASMSSDKTNTYIGERKGLVILVEYTDVKFKTTNNKIKFNNIFNKKNYVTSEGFVGSVKDYFTAQSNGLFTLDFDVLGPVQLAHKMKYYGENDKDGYDMRPEEMVIEGCKAINSQVNFADYDWDGDGKVDQVYVIYAGYQECDTYDKKPDTVWPHKWWISAATGKPLMLNGVAIDTYACGGELAENGNIDGIGTICHEFSHCLGFPDTYDTTGGTSSMGDWDVMCNGSYNGNGFCPPNYSAFQKMLLGWLNPIEITTDTLISNVLPTAEGGNAYKLVNSGYPDEYFLIENRQMKGWDKELPGKGLMINYIDYDKTLWEFNMMNTCGNYADINGYTPDDPNYDFYHAISNDHHRIALFCANNKTDYSSAGNLYPYLRKNSLTPRSKPASKLYHENSLGTMFMDLSILDITQNVDGTMSFRTAAEQSQPDAILQTSAKPAAVAGIYTLDGRYVGNDIHTLKHGMYLVNGRKVIK